jgi:hypothetical protein
MEAQRDIIVTARTGSFERHLLTRDPQQKKLHDRAMINTTLYVV